jgi:hypothetical protein
LCYSTVSDLLNKSDFGDLEHLFRLVLPLLFLVVSHISTHS